MRNNIDTGTTLFNYFQKNVQHA